jgi:hypothetical protein
MSTLIPDQRERLVKLLGLLGSNHDGERATAGRMAHELVRRSGLTWYDIALASPAARDGELHPDWRRLVGICLRFPAT